MGRFTSADPANAGADPMNPQSWNGYAYAYVNNNPLNAVDTSGMFQEANPSNPPDEGQPVLGPIDPITGFPTYYPNCQYSVICYGGGPVSGGGAGGSQPAPPPPPPVQPQPTPTAPNNAPVSPQRMGLLSQRYFFLRTRTSASIIRTISTLRPPSTLRRSKLRESLEAIAHKR